MVFDLTGLLNLGGQTKKGGFLSPELNADVDVSAPTNSRMSIYSPQTTSTNIDSRSSVYAPVDSRQLVLNINSAGTTTKKEDKISASAMPSLSTSVSPSQDLRPSMSTEGAGVPVLGSTGLNMTTALIIGGVVLGGALLLGGKK